MSVDGSNFLAIFNELMHEAQHTVLTGMSEDDFAPEGRNPAMVFAVAMKDPIPPVHREDGSNRQVEDYMATALKVVHVTSFQESLYLCMSAQYAAFTLVRSGLVCLKESDGDAYERIVKTIAEKHPELNEYAVKELSEDLTTIAYSITVDMMMAMVPCPNNH